MSSLPRRCEEFASLFVFYLGDELNPAERAAVESHLSRCEACREQLAAEGELLEMIGTASQAADRLDPAGTLLAQCRSEFAETLDDIAIPPAPTPALRFSWMRRWMAVHPVWSGGALVAFGLLLGLQSGQWFAGHSGSGIEQGLDVRPGPRLTDEQLSRMAVAGINFSTPTSGSPKVRLELSAEQPVVLTGSLDDSDVRHVLTYVVQNGNRFDPGVRLDCLDALKTRAQDVEVRRALLAAARTDQNPAVRLKALESLRDSSADGEVRDALLFSLQHDTNPGVRVEAVNLLVRSLEAGPPIEQVVVTGTDLPQVPPRMPLPDESLAHVVRALEQMQQRDPSRYVRMQSAVALRQIAARSEQ